MQVDPIEPMLKAPGYKHLKRDEENLISTLAFKFNLRRYIMVIAATPVAVRRSGSGGSRGAALHAAAKRNLVGRCRSTVSTPVLKAPMFQRLKVE